MKLTDQQRQKNLHSAFCKPQSWFGHTTDNRLSWAMRCNDYRKSQVERQIRRRGTTPMQELETISPSVIFWIIFGIYAFATAFVILYAASKNL